MPASTPHAYICPMLSSWVARKPPDGANCRSTRRSSTVRFQYVTDERGLLQLLPAEEEYAVAGEDCLRLTDTVAVTEEYRTEEIGPGETIEADVKLYALPEYDGCVPVGEFRFETTYAVGPSIEELDRRAQWGFAVVLD